MQPGMDPYWFPLSLGKSVRFFIINNFFGFNESKLQVEISKKAWTMSRLKDYRLRIVPLFQLSLSRERKKSVRKINRHRVKTGSERLTQSANLFFLPIYFLLRERLSWKRGTARSLEGL